MLGNNVYCSLQKLPNTSEHRIYDHVLKEKQKKNKIRKYYLRRMKKVKKKEMILAGLLNSSIMKRRTLLRMN